MAYNPNDLSALVYANGFTIWHYRTTDNYDDVDAYGGGYFNEAASMLRAGDFMYVNASTNGPARQHATLVITENKGGIVEVATMGYSEGVLALA